MTLVGTRGPNLLIDLRISYEPGFTLAASNSWSCHLSEFTNLRLASSSLHELSKYLQAPGKCEALQTFQALRPPS